MAKPLRVMPRASERRTLNPDKLRDPLGGDIGTAMAPRVERRDPVPPQKTAPPQSTAPPDEQAPGPKHDPPRISAELLTGPRAPVAVMFEPQIWTALVGCVDELREEQAVRSSANALLVAVLATQLPERVEEALDLIGRHELELADRGAEPRREQHTVRLPSPLTGRLDRLARGVREAGFDGGRSALVNAVLALRLPSNSEQAATALQGPRRARAAAVIRAA